MSMSKEQCKDVLTAAAEAKPCIENYSEACKAFEAGDYDLFEKICRGNLLWLEEKGINFPAPLEGPAVQYRAHSIVIGTRNTNGDLVGIVTTVDNKSGYVVRIDSLDDDGKTCYTLDSHLLLHKEDVNKTLKAIADEIYKHLGIEPTP